jgi:hypothetical protein
MGCAGVDILAYRATEAEPLDLVAACRRGWLGKGAVVVAGSVNSAERVSAIRAAGADAFTIGTAAIDATYAPGAGPLAAQLQAVLADCLSGEAEFFTSGSNRANNVANQNVRRTRFGFGGNVVQVGTLYFLFLAWGRVRCRQLGRLRGDFLRRGPVQ